MKNQESLLSIIFAFFIILFVFILSGSFILVLILLMVSIFLMIPILYPFIKKSLKLEDLSDRVYYVRTEDNWYIPLHYHEARFPKKKALPVILCHGIAQNKYAMDLDEFHSLAVYLKTRGYPVFVVSLRGAGKSFYKGIQKRIPYFTFDDHVFYDAPAIINKVIELTGAPKVNWIGFSLGGMIGYAVAGLELPVSRKLQTLIALGSPGKADYMNSKIIQKFIQHPWIGSLFPIRSGSRMISPLGRYIFTPLDKILYNPQNTKKRTIQYLLANCMEPINKGILDEFSQWARLKKELTVDKTLDYRKNLKNIKIPVLLIAGSVDHVAPPPQVRFVYEQISSPIKEFIIAGKRYNFKEDYGHLCLTVGEYAPEEIFPVIYNWLEKYGKEKAKRIKTWIQKIKRRWELNKILKKSKKSNRQNFNEK